MRFSGGTIIDGTGADPVRGEELVVENGRIVSLRAAVAGDGEVVDLSGLTVVPGLIDAHTHLGYVFPSSELTHGGTTSVAEIAARIFRNCELALDAGFTTVRDAGGLDGGTVRAIASGLVRGPRVFPSGPSIVQDGGHASFQVPFSDCWCPVAVPGLYQAKAICNSPDEVRLAARRHFRRGATQIKLMVTGGVVSLTDSLDDTQLSVAEIRAAVEEAEARNSYVTVHAHNVRGIRNALAAGVTCVEHGSFLDQDTARAMARAGAALVPTLAVANLMATQWRAWGLPEQVVPRVEGAEAAMGRSILLARQVGVLIGSGSDLLGPDQTRHGLELVLRSAVEDPMAALLSATRDNARIMQVGDSLGTLEPGKLADLVALEGDPLADPGIFVQPERAVVVVKDGQVVKDRRR